MEKKIILANCGLINKESIEDYIKKDGYSALSKALKMGPEKVIEEIKASKLVGRGGAAFPTGLKWESVYRSEDKEKYIVCNADEGEPGTFKDRKLLEEDPHKIIEGIIIGGYAIGASIGYIYIRKEFFKASCLLRKAIKQAVNKNYLGNNILGSNFNFQIEVREGMGSYVCGEETALFDSLEGKRGTARFRPPFPTQSGVWNKPTVINNVETIANIPIIILRGAEWYRNISNQEFTGTKLFCLSGSVKKPGVYEAPFGITLKELIYNFGKGLKNGKRLKAILCGGASGGFLTKEYLNLSLDYKSVAQAGAMLGSGAVIVFDDTENIIEVTKEIEEFFAEESCGKCTPCRIGTKRMTEILERIITGEGKKEDLNLMFELGNVMKDASLCGLGQAAPNPVLSSIKYFAKDYERVLRK